MQSYVIEKDENYISHLRGAAANLVLYVKKDLKNLKMKLDEMVSFCLKWQLPDDSWIRCWTWGCNWGRISVLQIHHWSLRKKWWYKIFIRPNTSIKLKYHCCNVHISQSSLLKTNNNEIQFWLGIYHSLQITTW